MDSGGAELAVEGRKTMKIHKNTKGVMVVPLFPAIMVNCGPHSFIIGVQWLWWGYCLFITF